MTTPEHIWHIGGHMNVTQMDEPLLDYLHSVFKFKTMLDLGCGPGGMVDMAIRKGIDAFGIDGDPAVAQPFIRIHDFTLGPYPHPVEVDFIWCVEFAEHVEEKYLDNWMPLMGKAKVVLFSHALLNQPGYHHVNCQDHAYWIKQFAKVGMRLSKKITDQARKVAVNYYTKDKAMVFIGRV